jgi:hypothetical protein
LIKPGNAFFGFSQSNAESDMQNNPWSPSRSVFNTGSSDGRSLSPNSRAHFHTSIFGSDGDNEFGSDLDSDDDHDADGHGNMGENNHAESFGERKERLERVLEDMVATSTELTKAQGRDAS